MASCPFKGWLTLNGQRFELPCKLASRHPGPCFYEYPTEEGSRG